MLKKILDNSRDYFTIILGCAIMAFVIKVFYEPAGLVTGGFSGVAIIVKRVTSVWIDGGIPLGLTTFILNIPLFIVAIKLKGFNFIKKTIIATTLLSIFLSVIPDINVLSGDMVLTSVFGGVFSGVGIGLIFISHATTGGTDLLAVLIQKKFPQFTIAQIMQVIDAVIVVIGAYIFGVQSAAYAIVVIYLVSRVSDGMIEGMKFSKFAYIISDKSDIIAKKIMEEIGRGVTSLPGVGMYTRTQKNILFCVVSKKEIIKLKEIVKKYDDKSFVIVHDIREVLGEGFQQN